jgi:dTDP-4-dehydrorhamnose reductase
MIDRSFITSGQEAFRAIAANDAHTLTAGRKVLITGARGMLGRAIAEQLRRYAPHWEVRALGRAEWDVRDASRVAEFADWLGDGWVCHCAALVDVEVCAKNPDLARETIVGGTSNVVKLASMAGARILYPQTFLVYDGAENPITELTLPAPLSLYSSLKFAAEGLVRVQSADNLVIRMAGFFGGEEKDKNFVGRIVPHIHQLIKAGQRTYEVGDRIWQPTYTLDLALNALVLMGRRQSGAYVMASHGEASFWELATEISHCLGWSGRIEILKASAGKVAHNELGRRPDRAVIHNARLGSEEADYQRPWRASLAEYLSNRYFDAYRL